MFRCYSDPYHDRAGAGDAATRKKKAGSKTKYTRPACGMNVLRFEGGQLSENKAMRPSSIVALAATIAWAMTPAMTRQITRDKPMIDQLKTIGIEKGKPFNPDEKTKRILADAVQEAHEVIAPKYESGFTPPFFEGTRWGLPIPPETRDGLSTMFADPNQYGIDGRALMYHQVPANVPAARGAGHREG